jgi:serine/threonine protein kinase
MRHKLTRHADVCARIARNPHVSLNLSSAPTATDDGWWIVDEWVGADTLADRLQSGPWPLDQLPCLLHDVAHGLTALHGAGVVFRELAPSHVLIAEQDGRAVLTDFELAKLLDGVPSVSEEWPDDPFRAPEVAGREATITADLYSLGRLAATGIAGKVPERGEEAAVFHRAKLPQRLLKLLTQCVAGFPDQRPQELAPLLKELARWAGR